MRICRLAAICTLFVSMAATGRYVREIGKNLYAWSFAHAVRVDRFDNIWAADEGVAELLNWRAQKLILHP